jgi:predicted DNA-binding antitoxin AbrB/MazE fold protein
MIHDIDAIFDHGVFRPVEPVALPEGARVRLRIEDKNGMSTDRSNDKSDYGAWLNGLAGRWQGDFVRGDEGEMETRESLS